jgi:hypothetical protein
MYDDPATEGVTVCASTARHVTISANDLRQCLRGGAKVDALHDSVVDNEVE